MDVIYLLIIGLLVILFGVILKKQKQKNHKLINEMEQSRIETTATLVDQETKFKEEKKDLLPKGSVIKFVEEFKFKHGEKDKSIQIQHENIIQKYEENIKELKSYVKDIEKQSRNFGEINTQKILIELKNDLIKKGEIEPSQMYILPNIFVPYRTKKGEVSSRQIDHIVLMNKGIYIVETKYWRGNILHGISKDRAGDFSFILDSFYPMINTSDEKTLVFLDNSGLDNEDERKEMRVVSYKDPATQVRGAASILNKLLKDHNENCYVTPIIYYGHGKKELTNYSNREMPHVCDTEELLREFFFNQIKESNKNYSVLQLERIKNIVENVNYLT